MTRLVFDKSEYMKTICTYFNKKTEFYYDVINFINTHFTMEDDVNIGSLYRVFEHCNEYKSQLNDIKHNTYYFNAYYINKDNEKTLKNFGPGFYTLGHISSHVNSTLKYQIELQYNNGSSTSNANALS